jgi:putative heme-binding domain-containing protein
MRSTAAGVLAKAKLTPEQLLALTETLKAAGPLEVPKLLGAYEKATDETLGLKLVAALKQSSGVAGLRAEMLTPRLTNFPETVRREADGLLASLNVDAAKQKAHLDELAAVLKEGDVRRGQGIFNSTKAACASCHAIGYLGGNIGPDLTRIGQVRTERDLLEAIVYPSASFVRSYEPIAVSTKSGDEYSGVLRRDNTDEIVLATGVGTEVRIARADITEMRPGTLSVMPSGLDEQLTRQELADLLAFLKATKW